MSVATTSVSTFLNASRFLAGQAWLVVAHVGVSLALAWVLAEKWGSAGVAWAPVACYLVIVVPVYLVVLPRVLARQRATVEAGP